MASYHFRTFIKPGITGLAQVRGFRGEAQTSEDIAPACNPTSSISKTAPSPLMPASSPALPSN